MRLFKYFPPARLDVLENLRLCFSTPQNLNDPFELQPPLMMEETNRRLSEYSRANLDEIVEQQLTEALGPMRTLATPEMLEPLKKKFLDNLDSVLEANSGNIQGMFNSAAAKHIGVLCLSEVNDDILMWAHYTDSHQGFVVEFDPSSAYFNKKITQEDEFRHLRKVIYSEVRPEFSLLTAKNLDAFLTKSPHWVYEKEWRMMVSVKDAQVVKEIGEKTFHLFDFPASAIVSITFGCRMTQENREKAIGAISLHQELEYIPFFESVPDAKLFQLNINPLNRKP